MVLNKNTSFFCCPIDSQADFISFLSLTYLCYGQIQQTTNWLYFASFSQKIGFDISCKVCIKCKILFSWKNKKTISKCCLLKFLPSMQSANTCPRCSNTSTMWFGLNQLKWPFRETSKDSGQPRHRCNLICTIIVLRGFLETLVVLRMNNKDQNWFSRCARSARSPTFT